MSSETTSLERHDLLQRYTIPKLLEISPSSEVSDSSLPPKLRWKNEHLHKKLVNVLQQEKREKTSKICGEINELELLKVISFIQSNPKFIEYVQKTGGGFIKRGCSTSCDLPKTLYVNNLGDIYINCKRHTTTARGIGSGSFKNVTLAIHYNTGQLFAFSTTKIKGRGASELVNVKKAYKREHRFGLVLQNTENVVSFKEVIYYSNKECFKQGVYTPYYRGGDLFHKLTEWSEKGGVEKCLREMKPVAFGILKGLSGIHSAGIVHRDIKPSNIFLDYVDVGWERIYRPHIGDFGLSVSKDDRKALRKLCGSKPYVPREWWNLHNCPLWSPPCDPLTQKIDVFAVGLILGYMFLNINPRHPDKNQREKSNPVYDDWSEPEAGTVEYLIWRMTRPNPDERISSHEALELAVPALSYFTPNPKKRARPAH